MRVLGQPRRWHSLPRPIWREFRSVVPLRKVWILKIGFRLDNVL